MTAPPFGNRPENTHKHTKICFQVLFANVVAKLLIQSELKSIFGPSADQLITECTELHNDEIRNPIRIRPFVPIKIILKV